MVLFDFRACCLLLFGDQLALTESAELKAFRPYISRREEQRLVQFLMALRSDFEGLRGTILHRTPWAPRPPQFTAAAAVPSSVTHDLQDTTSPPSALDPQVFEQFRQFLASMSHSGLSSSSTSGIPSNLWILDSGASHHMSPHLPSFASLSPGSPVSVMSASSTSMPVEGVGSVVTPHVSLSDVYYIPTLALNLVSVSQLCKIGYWVLF